MRTLAIWPTLAAALILAAREAPAQLKAGVGRAEVTPPVGGRMYGYGARGDNVSTGVHDPLMAKALVLDDGATRLALVTLDLGSFPEANTAAVKAGVQGTAGIEHVLLVASHSHSTGVFDDAFPNAEEPYPRRVELRIIGAVEQAARSLQPARLGVGWGEAREGHNRRFVLPNGQATMLWANRQRVSTNPVDYRVGVLRVENLEAEPIALVVNFQCHPVVLGPENLEISADYPGAMMRVVEAELGGQCMFMQGAAGDINPYWDKTPPNEGAFDRMERMGRALAEEVIRVARAIEDVDADPRLSVRTQIIPLAHRWDLKDPAIQASIRELYGERRLRMYLERYNRDLRAEINTVLIGPEIALATFPGEFFVEHGLALRAQSLFKHTFFAGYCNGMLGYFPTIKACTEGGYGAAEATIVEVGAGEKLVHQALINLYYQAGKLRTVP